jgi:hypothetical protein
LRQAVDRELASYQGHPIHPPSRGLASIAEHLREHREQIFRPRLAST